MKYEGSMVHRNMKEAWIHIDKEYISCYVWKSGRFLFFMPMIKDKNSSQETRKNRKDRDYVSM